jgi:hypothetical protein
MDIRQEILKQHSKQNTLRIANLIGNDEELIRKLLDLSLGDDHDIARKAAWILRCCFEKYPQELKNHIPRLIKFLHKKDVHHAVRRNILGILKAVDIPAKYYGELIDTCFGYIESGKETVAVKAFSIDIIANIASGEPAILQELKLVLEDQLPYGTSGFKSKASKIIKSVKGINYEF